MVPARAPSLRGKSSISGREQVIVEARPASPEPEAAPREPSVPKKRSSFTIVPAALPRPPPKTEGAAKAGDPPVVASQRPPAGASSAARGHQGKATVRFAGDGDAVSGGEADANISVQHGRQAAKAAEAGPTPSQTAAPPVSGSAPFGARRGGSRHGFSVAPRAKTAGQPLREYNELCTLLGSRMH